MDIKLIKQHVLSVIVCSLDHATAKLLETQIPTIQTLIKGCTSVMVVTKTEDVPAGCLAESIDSNVTAHLLVAVCDQYPLSLHEAMLRE